ncbi:hypothetical protein [Candidatus Carsonella ruddii]|uniref:Uncharacterized protein n=1 Tax=Carsonella ruddii TaxID=114186 RepID=A0A1U9RSI1_CARRU|nr:hypothetical protein [Candidatus Carsonella ruddii]AQU89531.1 hypothetical protein BW244_0113 [Candidatus Carsonella ruddii]
MAVQKSRKSKSKSRINKINKKIIFIKNDFFLNNNIKYICIK